MSQVTREENGVKQDGNREEYYINNFKEVQNHRRNKRNLERGKRL